MNVVEKEMVMHEKWIKWEPVEALAPLYYIDEIHDTMAGFTIKLSEYKDEKKGVILLFENGIEGYRNADESFRYKTILYLHKQYGDSFLGQWTFFKVQNSSYIQWLLEESCGTNYSLSLTHFSFFTGNDVLDVVSTDEPTVTLWDLVNYE